MQIQFDLDFLLDSRSFLSLSLSLSCWSCLSLSPSTFYWLQYLVELAFPVVIAPFAEVVSGPFLSFIDLVVAWLKGFYFHFS